MKAIIWTKYGPPDVLVLREVEKPIPGDGEVLVRIAATTVTTGDCEMRRLKLPLFLSIPMRFYVGLRKPKRILIPGMELAGEIESIGKDVTRFKPGDLVFGSTGFGMGAYAEYICLPETPGEMDGVLAIQPRNISFQEAAAVTVGGLEALHFLRKINIRAGQKILIIGAGGSIGTVAVQLARHFGAAVTAVDSAKKLETLRCIGAEQVIDFTLGDYTKHGETYDVIFDVAGRSSFSNTIKMLKKNGSYLMANPGLSQMVRGALISMVGSKKVLFGSASHKLEDLNFLKELMEAGVIKTVIDRTYPLEQTAEAHRYVETGQKLGNVVITILPGNENSSK